jgi:hypothetical protein
MNNIKSKRGEREKIRKFIKSVFPKNHIISIQLPRNEIQKVEELARKKGLTINETIRFIVTENLKEYYKIHKMNAEEKRELRLITNEISLMRKQGQI